MYTAGVVINSIVRFLNKAIPSASETSEISPESNANLGDSIK